MVIVRVKSLWWTTYKSFHRNRKIEKSRYVNEECNQQTGVRFLLFSELWKRFYAKFLSRITYLQAKRARIHSKTYGTERLREDGAVSNVFRTDCLFFIDLIYETLEIFLFYSSISFSKLNTWLFGTSTQCPFWYLPVSTNTCLSSVCVLPDLMILSIISILDESCFLQFVLNFWHFHFLLFSLFVCSVFIVLDCCCLFWMDYQHVH